MEKEWLSLDPSENWGCRAHPLPRDLEKQQNPESHTWHLLLESHIARPFQWHLWLLESEYGPVWAWAALVGCNSRNLPSFSQWRPQKGALESRGEGGEESPSWSVKRLLDKAYFSRESLSQYLSSLGSWKQLATPAPSRFPVSPKGGN